MFEQQIANLSDWVVERFPTSPGNGMVWRFTDIDGKVGKVQMTQGGRVIMVTDRWDAPLTTIPTGKILIALPFVGTELLVRYALSRVWKTMAHNRIRRDMIHEEWQVMNMEALSNMLKFGVVVAPRPEIRKKDDE